MVVLAHIFRMIQGTAVNVADVMVAKDELDSRNVCKKNYQH